MSIDENVKERGILFNNSEINKLLSTIKNTITTYEPSPTKRGTNKTPPKKKRK